MNLKEVLKRKREILSLEREKEKEIHKRQIENKLSMPWNDEQIVQYRKLINMATYGLVGLDYSEYDIKKFILMKNEKRFTEEEYQKYLNDIIPSSCCKEYIKKR